MTDALEVQLVRRLAQSPFTRGLFWEDAPRLRLEAAHTWTLRDRGVFLPDDAPVDATLHASAADLDRMLAGEAPTGTVRYALGSRPRPDRRKQAHALLALAALGWCGPWPDPNAEPEHVHLLREAWWDLGIGPADARGPLFPPGGPVDAEVRVTESVAGVELVTCGLAARSWPELSVHLPPRSPARSGLRLLRAGALWLAEHGALPTVLQLDDAHPIRPHPRFPDGLWLPNVATWVLRVG